MILLSSKERNATRNLMAGTPPWEPSNARDDHGRPAREDYSIEMITPDPPPEESITIGDWATGFPAAAFSAWLASYASDLVEPLEGFAPTQIMNVTAITPTAPELRIMQNYAIGGTARFLYPFLHLPIGWTITSVRLRCNLLIELPLGQEVAIFTVLRVGPSYYAAGEVALGSHPLYQTYDSGLLEVGATWMRAGDPDALPGWTAAAPPMNTPLGASASLYLALANSIPSEFTPDERVFYVDDLIAEWAITPP